MRDLLVRYLLGELRADERQRLEDGLRKSPELRRELEYLRECLPSTENTFEDSRGPAGVPPSGLAERTIERISGWEEGTEPSAALPSAASSAAAESGTSTPYWSLVDLTVAGGVLLAVSMLFLPAMRQSRDASRRTVCADNMRQIGQYLTVYSNNHEGSFPAGRQNENAGMFAVILVGSHIVTADELRRLVVCPSSPLAEEIAAGCVVVRVPSPAELSQASRFESLQLRRVMGGSLAYRIGYGEGEDYQLVRNMHCPRTPLMADEPSAQPGARRSANHGCGTNMLYQSGNVKFIKNCELREVKDDPYLNDNGLPAAGCHPRDAVLVRSELVPAAAQGPDLGEQRLKRSR
jgi:hypothetical protein